MSEEKLESLYEELEKLANENIPQYERGILEASAEEAESILKDLREIFVKYGVHGNTKIGILQSNQKVGEDTFLVCAGLQCVIDFNIKGKDKNGNNGNYSNEVKDKIAELQEKIKILEEKKDDE